MKANDAFGMIKGNRGGIIGYAVILLCLISFSLSGCTIFSKMSHQGENVGIHEAYTEEESVVPLDAGDDEDASAHYPLSSSIMEGQSQSGLTVHFIDVGQGDATLFSRDGEHMLVDAGDTTKGTLIQHYLKKHEVSELKYIVLTHPDSDHVGGAPVIVTKFDIGTVFVSNYKKANAVYERLSEVLAYRNLQGVEPALDSPYRLGTAKVTFLAPLHEYDNPNDASLVLSVQYGNVRFLLTGDAEENAEGELLAAGKDVGAEVYKAGHHGSSDASSEAFLSAVHSKSVVISCAEGNPYGHPHAEVLNQCRSMGADVYRTDEAGTIVAYTDGEEVRWNVPPSETWKPGTSVAKSTESDGNGGRAVPIDGGATDETIRTIEVVETTYVLNTNTKRFHIPTCSSVQEMKEKNKAQSTATRDELIEQGYLPCGRCHP